MEIDLTDYGYHSDGHLPGILASSCGVQSTTRCRGYCGNLFRVSCVICFGDCWGTRDFAHGRFVFHKDDVCGLGFSHSSGEGVAVRSRILGSRPEKFNAFPKLYHLPIVASLMLCLYHDFLRLYLYSRWQVSTSIRISLLVDSAGCVYGLLSTTLDALREPSIAKQSIAGRPVLARRPYEPGFIQPLVKSLPFPFSCWLMAYPMALSVASPDLVSS